MDKPKDRVQKKKKNSIKQGKKMSLSKRLSLNLNDSIEVSKQLACKIRNTRNKTTRAKISKSIIEEPRLCGNGKPMPSLTELEKMFEDSDDDIQSNSPKTQINYGTKNEAKVDDEKVLIKTMASKMLDLLSNMSNSQINIDDDNQPRPPVIPQKRPKKSDIPYIVGCKDRPRIPNNPTANFCKGGDDYGVDVNASNSDEIDTCPKKRRRGCGKANLSKSIFNAQSDEIAAKLKLSDTIEENSSDSNKTVSYDFINSDVSFNNPARSFSPLPSTSKDNATYLKNVERFNESIACETFSDHSSQNNDVEVIEIPCETILIDDEKIRNDFIEIVEAPMPANSSKYEHELETVVDYYSSIDTSPTYDPDVCEIIDVDDVIAENKAIIEKYNNNKKNVIYVQPNLSYVKSPSKIGNSMNTQNINNLIEKIVVDYFDKKSTDKVSNKIESDCIDLTHTLQEWDEKIKDWVSKINQDAQKDKSRKDESIINLNKRGISPKINKDNSVNTKHNPLRINPIVLQGSINLINTDPIIINDVAQDISQITGCSLQNTSIYTTVIPTPSESTLSSVLRNFNDHDYVTSTTVIHNQKKKRTRQNNTNNKNKTTKTTETVIPVKEISNEEGTRRIGDCPICLENLSTKAVASTICGHIFCMDCIKVALKAGGKRCPNCRKLLRGVGYHQLFL